MKATQLNLPLDNEIGTLARLCRDLAREGVNLLALSAPETGREAGTVRLLVPNGDLASRALSRTGYVFSSEEVLFIELKNRPGRWQRLSRSWPVQRSVSGTHMRQPRRGRRRPPQWSL